MNNQLIPTFTGDLAGETQPLVNARDLHAFLGVGKDFSTWLKDRIAQYGFVEGVDFARSPNLGSGENQGLSRFVPGWNKSEHKLTLDMAKELAMLENNERGRQARRYFIAVEKAAQSDMPAVFVRPGQVEALQLKRCQAELLKHNPDWAKLSRYRALPLSQAEIARLMGWSGHDSVRRAYKQMAAVGLIDYAPDPLLAAAGRKGLAIAQGRQLASKGGAS